VYAKKDLNFAIEGNTAFVKRGVQLQAEQSGKMQQRYPILFDDHFISL